jgi:hypothetical protein
MGPDTVTKNSSACQSGSLAVRANINVALQLLTPNIPPVIKVSAFYRNPIVRWQQQLSCYACCPAVWLVPQPQGLGRRECLDMLSDMLCTGWLGVRNK